MKLTSIIQIFTPFSGGVAGGGVPLVIAYTWMPLDRQAEWTLEKRCTSWTPTARPAQWTPQTQARRS